MIFDDCKPTIIIYVNITIKVILLLESLIVGFILSVFTIMYLLEPFAVKYVL